MAWNRHQVLVFPATSFLEAKERAEDGEEHRWNERRRQERERAGK
jgi:hypothetical protein